MATANAAPHLYGQRNLMNTENTKNQGEGEGILLGFFGTILLLAILSGIVFASLKWHGAELIFDAGGNITAVSKTWWGIKKKERVYYFDPTSKTWKESGDSIPKALLIDTEGTIKL